MTLYQVLGLPQAATERQVKAAFRVLARRFHPDVNAGDQIAEERFKEVNQAYETLADPEARKVYDRALVCRQSEAQRRSRSLTNTTAAAFALTASTIFLTWWIWHKTAPQSEESHTRGRVNTAHSRAQQGAANVSPNSAATASASPQDRRRGSSWVTYKNARFGFTLKYPADLFTFERTPANDNGVTLVSRDGRATLLIFAAVNVTGMTIAKYRRLLIEKRYAGVTLDHMPQSKFWFVLSGRRDDKVRYEQVTFSCDGRTIHGWQMSYPLSERTFYDLVADEVHRNYVRIGRPGARCG